MKSQILRTGKCSKAKVFSYRRRPSLHSGHIADGMALASTM